MRLEGELGFASVDALLPQVRDFAGGALDLSGVRRIDSAGAALLLELSRRAQARGGSLTLTNANAQVLGLLRFFKLDGLLDVSAQSAP